MLEKGSRRVIRWPCYGFAMLDGVGRGRRFAAMCSALVASLAVACVQPPRSSQANRAETQQLALALRALPGAITSDDADLLAARSFAITRELEARYRPLRPPLLGNLAFHLGLRDRALCCHWVQDLLRELTALQLPSVDLHWGVAHLGSTLREHSAVVVVPRGARFEQGLVLDAWRHSGRLYFTRLDRDRYPWRLHPADAVRHQLACGADR